MPVQPGRESRFAAKGSNLPKQLKKCFLGQIFGLGGIGNHAQT